jgi:hypothetical protein
MCIARGITPGIRMETNCFGVNFCLKEAKIMTKQEAPVSIELTLRYYSASMGTLKCKNNEGLLERPKTPHIKIYLLKFC